MLQTANGGVGGEFSRLEIMYLSVRLIEITRVIGHQVATGTQFEDGQVDVGYSADLLEMFLSSLALGS